MTASAREWERPGLTEAGRRIALAAVEAFLCDRRAGELVRPDAAWCQRVVRSFDLALGACSGTLRLAFRMLVRLLEWLPLVVIGAPRRMSRLGLSERVRYLEALERHRVALFAVLLVGNKVPMLMSAFEEGEALAATGFDRPSTASRRQRLPLAAEE